MRRALIMRLPVGTLLSVKRPLGPERISPANPPMLTVAAGTMAPFSSSTRPPTVAKAPSPSRLPTMRSMRRSDEGSDGTSTLSVRHSELLATTAAGPKSCTPQKTKLPSESLRVVIVSMRLVVSAMERTDSHCSTSPSPATRVLPSAASVLPNTTPPLPLPGRRAGAQRRSHTVAMLGVATMGRAHGPAVSGRSATSSPKPSRSAWSWNATSRRIFTGLTMRKRPSESLTAVRPPGSAVTSAPPRGSQDRLS